MGRMFRFEDFGDGDVGIRESSAYNRTKLLPLGRVLNVMFSAETRELEKVLTENPSRLPQGAIGKAGSALCEHVKSMMLTGSSLEQICVPILQHVVKSKEQSYRKKSLCLMRWLLQSEEFGVTVARNLATIIGSTKWDNRVKLGWCVVIRDLVQGWSGLGNANNPLHTATFVIFVACIPQLANIVSSSSVREEKRKIPTRLTLVAADCLLVITKTLAVEGVTKLENSSKPNHGVDQPRRSLISPIYEIPDYERTDGRIGTKASDGGDSPSTSSSDLFCSSEKRNLALWEKLDNLVYLVRELHEWNDRSRPLFAKGLQWVQKQLQSLADYRDSLKSHRGGEGDVSIGAAVLAACWQHYGGLLLSDDKKLSTHPQAIIQHWLGALQYYLQQTEISDTDEDVRRAQELRGYALACLSLTLGRLDTRRLEVMLEEFEPELLKALFGQLHGGDNSIIDLAVAILRTILFRQPLSVSNSAPISSTSRLESVVPQLMDMLDTRDIASRAVVLLVAEYFAVNPDSLEMEKLFLRLDAEDTLQRRNALDVLAELVTICTRNVDTINSTLSQTIAMHLFKRLGDLELTHRVEASALFAKLDPSFTLPTLVELLYSPDGRIRSAASAGLLSVMKEPSNQIRVIGELLDYVTKIVKGHISGDEALQEGPTNGTRNSVSTSVDVDRVMRLIPDWASTVEDWNSVIHLVLEKMFEDPVNAVIPRFLSYISSQLADRTHIVFPLLLGKLRDQPKLTEAILSKLNEDNLQESVSGALATQLFQRLSPLLVLRVLPLKAFNEINCSELYGGWTYLSAGEPVNADDMGLDSSMVECINSHLLERAFGAFEFEDVRKVAAELTGRLVPEIMIPQVTAQLEHAVSCQDLLRVKACIYALCTTLVVRGKESLNHPLMQRIRAVLTSILLWPCVIEEKGSVEISKAQHGCIDCLAVMILAENQTGSGLSSFDISTETSGRGAQMEMREESAFKTKPLNSRTEDAVVFEHLPLGEQASSSLSNLRPKIKLIEELPDSEQMKSRLSSGIEGGKEEKKLLVESAKLEQFNSELSGERKQGKLIEELSEKRENIRTSVAGGRQVESPPTILSSVIDCLTGHQLGLPWPLGHDTQEKELSLQQKSTAKDISRGSSTLPLGFRVCMANILISLCQKVSEGSRVTIAAKIIPPVITFIQGNHDSKLRGACLQVLFTAVYHLKTISVLPYAVDLFHLSISAIRSRGLLEERMAGAKLLASLLASDESLVRDLAPYLMDAQMTLASMSAIDTSSEFRVLCEKLLTCLSTPGAI